jgi:hypothetical protein
LPHYCRIFRLRSISAHIDGALAVRRTVLPPAILDEQATAGGIRAAEQALDCHPLEHPQEHIAENICGAPLQWWAWIWSHGDRAVLESLTGDVNKFRQELFAEISRRASGDGLSYRVPAAITFGTKR